MKTIKSGILISILFFNFCFLQLHAQNDLLNILDKAADSARVKYTINTFKGTHLINGHSVETRSKGVLEFLIHHRFGLINSGAYEFFGLDNATIRIGLNYSITDRLTIGVGRSSFNKVYDGYLKYKLLRQSSGSRGMPLTATLFVSSTIQTLRSSNPAIEIPFERKLAYTFQALLARKFTESLSLQLMPSWVHRNYVSNPADVNNLFALGIGGRLKFSQRMAVTAEYYYRLNGTDVNGLYNSLSVGIDIETGGHVFQLMFTNSRQMIEKGFIGETDGTWEKGDIHFGFNISRVFYLNSSSKKPEKNW